MITAFLKRLAATEHVEIIPLSGRSAVEGLKDQVLQRGPASRKGGVKTGGSDSAWLREVIDKADNATDRLLFLSSDNDIVQACERWGHEPPILRPNTRSAQACSWKRQPAVRTPGWWRGTSST